MENVRQRVGSCGPSHPRRRPKCGAGSAPHRQFHIVNTGCRHIAMHAVPSHIRANVARRRLRGPTNSVKLRMAFMNDVFHRFAQRAATAVGSPWAFVIAVLAIVTWAFTGPAVGFSTTWQLVINTGTTIVTFLIVFLIQNTQNRESQAVQLKLDELISVSTGSNALIDVEGMTDQQATTLLKRFHRLAEKVADQ